jgi:hypothetical protein
MDNEISSFDDYLKRYNIKKEEPTDNPDIDYESDREVLQKELEEIEEVFGPDEEEVKPDESNFFRVRVVVNRLRYFSGPGVNYVVFGRAKRGDEFNIVEESTGLGALKWGRMQSDGGWIPLDHCERVGVL